MTLLEDLVSLAIVDDLRGEETDAGMPVLLVVPGEEELRKRVAVLDGTKAVRESGGYLPHRWLLSSDCAARCGNDLPAPRTNAGDEYSAMRKYVSAVAVQTVRKHHGDLTVLQCTSEYPCSYERVGLNMLREMRQRYGLPVGKFDTIASGAHGNLGNFADHSTGRNKL